MSPVRHSRLVVLRLSALVLISCTVLLFAQLAIAGRQRVIDPVFDRRKRFQEGEHGFQVVVGEALEFAVEHDLVQFASADVSRAHRGHEGRLAVVADARGIGRDIRAREVAPGTAPVPPMRREFTSEIGGPKERAAQRLP
jgi:hypothetical protein